MSQLKFDIIFYLKFPISIKFYFFIRFDYNSILIFEIYFQFCITNSNNKYNERGIQLMVAIEVEK